jgi:hypothetical protein
MASPKFIPNKSSVTRLDRGGMRQRARFVPTARSVGAMAGGNYAPAAIIPTGMRSVGTIPVSTRELAAKDAIFLTTLP